MRIMLTLPDQTFDSIKEMARAERRDPKRQAEVLLIEAVTTRRMETAK